MPLYRPFRVAVAVALLVGAASTVPAQSARQSARRSTQAPAGRVRTLPAAPYVAPSVGAKYAYTNFTHTVTRVSGWRTYFTDARGAKVVRIANFIPEDPRNPVTIPDSALLTELWPLKMGKTLNIHTARDDRQWQWTFAVVDTETVRVPAGRFLTYRVDGIENTVLTRDPKSSVTNLVTWWYAPEVGVVVRAKFIQAKGPRQGGMARNELLRIER